MSGVTDEQWKCLRRAGARYATGVTVTYSMPRTTLEDLARLQRETDPIGTAEDERVARDRALAQAHQAVLSGDHERAEAILLSLDDL